MDTPQDETADATSNDTSSEPINDTSHQDTLAIHEDVAKLMNDFDTETLEEDEKEQRERSRKLSIKEMLQSADIPSRFATVISLAFTILSITSLVILAYLLSRTKAQNARLNEEASKPVVEVTFYQPLGNFRVFLKKELEKERDPEVRVDITVECSTEPACLDLKNKLQEVRDLIHPILAALTVQEMLDPDTKELLRKRIADQLGGFTSQGKIIKVNFTDMTIENGK